jgi:hypothetical protein
MNKYRHVLVIAALLTSSLPSSAQIFKDDAIYSSDSKAYAKFDSGAVCASDGTYCLMPIRDENSYERVSRFYFLPGPKPRIEEGVWHVRTQTEASNLAGADYAYLYRPPYPTTRCSPNKALPALSRQDRLVTLNRYGDFHVEEGDTRGPDYGLTNSFHFDIEKSPKERPCVNTSDTSVFKNLKKIYGFDGVTRTPQVVAGHLSTAAYADSASKYAGLSSEFAYYDGDATACFGFSAPIATRSDSFGSNLMPTRTAIIIKRIKGGDVSTIFDGTVIWRK